MAIFLCTKMSVGKIFLSEFGRRAHTGVKLSELGGGLYAARANCGVESMTPSFITEPNCNGSCDSCTAANDSCFFFLCAGSAGPHSGVGFKS